MTDDNVNESPQESRPETPSASGKPAAPTPPPKWIVVGGAVLGGLVILVFALLVFTGSGSSPADESATGDGEGDSAPEETTTAVTPELDELEMHLAAVQGRASDNDARIDDLTRQLDALEHSIQGLQDDLDAVASAAPGDAVIEELRADLEAVESAASSDARDEVDALAEDMEALQARLARLEAEPETPELDAVLVGIDHWGGTLLAVVDRAGDRQELSVGDRVGDWRLVSIDPDAGVAVLTHPQGFTHALAMEEN